MPTTILGAVPHATTADDRYKGFLIPKGAGVMNNAWAINMDPTRAPEPRRFNPDRHVDDHLSLYDSASNPDGKRTAEHESSNTSLTHVTGQKRDQFTFGAGRRICPGMHVAERSLFLGIARILWAFDILPKIGADGKPILPDQEKLTQGFVCMPEIFAARIVPRSAERADIVRREWKACEETLLDAGTKQWVSSPI